MIKLFSLFVLVLGMTVDTPKETIVNNNTEPDTYCGVSNTAFNPGEKLIYTIYYNWGFIWLPAGEVIFEVKENKDNYQYSAIGKSYASYNWIFEVEDYFYSYVDKNTLLPIRAKRNINEGGYRIKNDIQFDQKRGKAMSEVVINDKTTKIVFKDFDSCLYDILSVIYSLRNTDKSQLSPGEQLPFSMMLDDEIYPLQLEYIGNTGDIIVKNLGEYDAVEISPTVIKGRVFAKNERMHIWISNDKNNVPLIIESPLAVGKIKVTLKDYHGLRYPLVNHGN